jgi:hypothetical protein
MLLQRSITGVCRALLWFPEQMVPACIAKVSCSTEYNTRPIAYLIIKQAIPYQTRGGTCCPGVSTPKIQSLAGSSTTCRDGINHLHHSNHCSNHIIDPHHGQITSRWMGDHLSERHKPFSTSQRMERLIRHR